MVGNSGRRASSVNERFGGNILNNRQVLCWLGVLNMGNRPAKQEKEEYKGDRFVRVPPPLDRTSLYWLARDLERIHRFTPVKKRAVKPPEHYKENMRLHGWLDVDLDDPELAHLFK